MSKASSCSSSCSSELVGGPNRLVGLTAHCPVVVGNVCQLIIKPVGDRPDAHPFEWTTYVRGLDFEDLSYFIDKVVFRLHESFKQPIRVVDKPPFEVSETGWGQFWLKIDIYVKHAADDMSDIITVSSMPSVSKTEMARFVSESRKALIHDYSPSLSPENAVKYKSSSDLYEIYGERMPFASDSDVDHSDAATESTPGSVASKPEFQPDVDFFQMTGLSALSTLKNKAAIGSVVHSSVTDAFAQSQQQYAAIGTHSLGGEHSKAKAYWKKATDIEMVRVESKRSGPICALRAEGYRQSMSKKLHEKHKGPKNGARIVAADNQSESGKLSDAMIEDILNFLFGPSALSASTSTSVANALANAPMFDANIKKKCKRKSTASPSVSATRGASVTGGGLDKASFVAAWNSADEMRRDRVSINYFLNLYCNESAFKQPIVEETVVELMVAEPSTELARALSRGPLRSAAPHRYDQLWRQSAVFAARSEQLLMQKVVGIYESLMPEMNAMQKEWAAIQRQKKRKWDYATSESSSLKVTVKKTNVSSPLLALTPRTKQRTANGKSKGKGKRGAVASTASMRSKTQPTLTSVAPAIDSSMKKKKKATTAKRKKKSPNLAKSTVVLSPKKQKGAMGRSVPLLQKPTFSSRKKGAVSKMKAIKAKGTRKKLDMSQTTDSGTVVNASKMQMPRPYFNRAPFVARTLPSAIASIQSKAAVLSKGPAAMARSTSELALIARYPAKATLGFANAMSAAQQLMLSRSLGMQPPAAAHTHSSGLFATMPQFPLAPIGYSKEKETAATSETGSRKSKRHKRKRDSVEVDSPSTATRKSARIKAQKNKDGCPPKKRRKGTK